MIMMFMTSNLIDFELFFLTSIQREVEERINDFNIAFYIEARRFRNKRCDQRALQVHV